MRYGKPIRYLVTIQPVYDDMEDDINPDSDIHAEYTEEPRTSNVVEPIGSILNDVIKEPEPENIYTGYITLAVGFGLESKGAQSRWCVVNKSKNIKKKTFSFAKHGREGGFILAVKYLLEHQDTIALKVNQRALPLPYTVILEKCGITTKQIYFI